jgi:hypothetical protein
MDFSVSLSLSLFWSPKIKWGLTPVAPKDIQPMMKLQGKKEGLELSEAYFLIIY